MNESASPKKSRLKLLLIALPILLLVAIIANWQEVRALARGERTLKGILYGATRSPDYDLENWEVPDHIGAEDAKVIIEVFLCSGDPCHVDSLFLGQALGTIDPERIRVVWQNTATAAGRARFSEMHLGCEQGLAIDGKTKFTVPVTDPESDRDEKTMYMTYDSGWGHADLWVILDHELREAYEGEGLSMTAEELSEELPAAIKRFRDQAIEEAKAKNQENG